MICLCAQARLLLHRGKHALDAAASLLSAKDVTAGKTKFGHLNICLKRVLQGGRGDEVTVQAGRKKGMIKTETHQHAAAASFANISSAPLDHELSQASSDFMYNTQLHAGAVCAQLAPLLLPADVQAQAIETVRDAPVEDILQHTQWERAKRSMQRQEELQQSMAQALPTAACTPHARQAPPLAACTEQLAALWPTPVVHDERRSPTGLVAASRAEPSALGARPSRGPKLPVPAAAPASAPHAAATAGPDSAVSATHGALRVELSEKINIGLLGSEVKLASAVVQAKVTQAADGAFVTVQTADGLLPQSSQLQAGESCVIKGSVAGGGSPLVAVTSKVKWSGSDGLLVVRGRFGPHLASEFEPVSAQCDVVLQLGGWLGQGTLVSVKASSSVKLASNKQDVLWHIPRDNHVFGEEVQLKAKCTAAAPLAPQLQGQVLATPWKARVRTAEYDAGGRGGTRAAAVHVHSGAPSPCEVVGTTELVIVAKAAAPT